jgi:signal transduction histidine kinase
VDAPLLPLRILLVDDAPADRRAVVRTLRRAHPRGVQVLEVEGAEGFRHALEAPRCSLALLSARVAWSAPAALLAELRARQPGLPVVLLTGGDPSCAPGARAEEDVRAEEDARREAGAQALLDAPEGPDDAAAKGPAGERELLRAVRRTLELARLRQALEEARAFEARLVGLVGHELRSPLNAVHLAAHVLKREGALEARQQLALRRITQATQRAHRLIRDVLDFAQVRAAGGLAVQRGPVDLHQLVRSASDALASCHPRRRLVLETEGEGRGEWDGDRLAQVVESLVGHALVHGPVGSPVHICARGEEAHWVLSVHHAGPPLAPEALDHLFEPYRPGKDAGGSAGLGLYVARAVVEAHGGSVAVESSAADGTTVTVRLPRQTGSGQELH